MDIVSMGLGHLCVQPGNIGGAPPAVQGGPNDHRRRSRSRGRDGHGRRAHSRGRDGRDRRQRRSPSPSSRSSSYSYSDRDDTEQVQSGKDQRSYKGKYHCGVTLSKQSTTLAALKVSEAQEALFILKPDYYTSSVLHNHPSCGSVQHRDWLVSKIAEETSLSLSFHIPVVMRRNANRFFELMEDHRARKQTVANVAVDQPK